MSEHIPAFSDANGAGFLLLSGPDDFAAPEPDAPAWDGVAGVLRMPHRDVLRLADVGREAALAAWEGADPLAEDGFGQIARITADGTGLEYALSWPIRQTAAVTARAESRTGGDLGAVQLDPVTAPEGTRLIDLAIRDARLAALFAPTEPPSPGARHGVLVVDLERRWQRTVTLSAAAQRVWVDAGARVWAAGDTDLMLVTGSPLPQPYLPRPDRFEPVEIEPDPPRERWRRLLPDGLALLAMASDEQRLHLLTWRVGEDGAAVQAVVSRPLDDDPALPWTLAELPDGLPFAVDLRAVAEDTLALMLPAEPEDTAFRNCDLPVVRLDGGAATVIGRRWPQPAQQRPRFTADAEGRVRIVTPAGPQGLHPLAQARHDAQSVGTLAPLDSGQPGAEWHRLYLDACVPVGCSLAVEARAFDGAEPEGAWIVQPAPVWVPLASELGFAGGRFAPVPGREGLFEVLLMLDDGAVRRMRGRRLQLRLTMGGDGRHSPAIAAVRAYYPRNSWQEQFLPPHLRQQAAAGTGGPGNGADLRERLLASLEGVLTPVENRISAAECWLYPDGAPADRLDGLAAMLGTAAPAHWPERRRRRWIAATAELQQKRGTLSGLALALDIATDGAVARGHVVPVETYRLRRTTATILGLDLDDADHPLTLGTQLSGNSIVGPSLILSEETGRDFLALFAPELARGVRDRRVVERFFDRHAHRVDIVLHGPARPLRAVVEGTLAEQVPAGVVWRMIETDQPFVLGLAPLLGIDTLLETSPAWRRVMLDDTFLGREGVLQSPAAFAPEAAGYAESIAELMARRGAFPTAPEGETR